MKIMNCPLNGPRNISEFVWAGDIKPMPPAACTDDQWAAYLFLEENKAGEVYEWWLHGPTNFWFVARRNTLTDEILETMTSDDYAARHAPAGLAETESAAADSTGGEA